MGILEKLFGAEKAAKIPPAPPRPQKQIITTEESYSDASQNNKNKREWEYYCPPEILSPDISVNNVVNAVNAYGCQYFQNELKQIEDDTIDIFIVNADRVRKCDVPWNFNKPKSEKECYIVDENGVMLGYLNRFNIGKTGYKIGEKARAAITKPPAGGDMYNVFILKKRHGSI